MGINDREYVREDDAGSQNTFGSEFPIVRNLIALTVLVFVLQLLIIRPFNQQELESQFFDSSETVAESTMDATLNGDGVSVPQEWLKLDSRKVQQGQIWRVLTAGFCHAQRTLHPVIINLVILFWLGRRLESRFGSRQFLWMYVTAIVISSLAFCGFLTPRGQSSTTLGATGAIMAVMTLYALSFRGEQIRFFGIVSIPFPVFVALFVLYDLSPILGARSWLPTDASHLSHLFGLAYGLVFWKTGMSLGGLVPERIGNRSNSRPNRRQLKTQKASADPSLPDPQKKNERRKPNLAKMEKEVDRILTKITESGRESLSASERSTLEKASQHYNKNNQT